MMSMIAPQRIERVKRIFAIAAWAMLGWVILGYITTIPAVDQKLAAIEQVGAFRAVEAVAFFVIGATALVLWGVSVWYGLLTNQRRSAKRIALIFVLVAGNFVAAFFYYFVHVLWQRNHTVVSSR